MARSTRVACSGFDDLCPTMNWKVWDRVERLLDERYPAYPGAHPGKRRPQDAARARRTRASGSARGRGRARDGSSDSTATAISTTPAAGLVPWWSQSEFAGHAAVGAGATHRDGLRAHARRRARAAGLGRPEPLLRRHDSRRASGARIRGGQRRVRVSAHPRSARSRLGASATLGGAAIREPDPDSVLSPQHLDGHRGARKSHPEA